MKYALGFSLLVSILILGTFLVPNSAYAQNAVQDPGDINLSVSDLTRVTWWEETRYDGPSEISDVMEGGRFPYSETIWANWEFEVGSGRFFRTSDGFIHGYVFRFSSSIGAESELHHVRREIGARIPMFEFSRIGDECFALCAPEGVYPGIYFYFVKFRKGQFTVELLTNSFDEARESSRLIESRIEASLGQGDPLCTVIAFGGAGAILSTIAYIIIERRGQAKSLLPGRRKKNMTTELPAQ